MKTIKEMTAEVRRISIDHGWRSAEGGPGRNTFGDYIALLHSEASEALEAYRDHRLADATEQRSCWPVSVPLAPHSRHALNCQEMPKPEGVGSEFADVLIRLLDMADVFGIDLNAEYERKVAYNRTRPYQHGGRTA